MKKITLENVYDKLDGMRFKLTGRLLDNAFSMDTVNWNDRTLRVAIIDIETKTIEITDFAEDDEEFEIFKGSWHDFLEWE